MSARRIEALEARRAELDAALSEELKRPLPSLEALRALKQRKLLLKDEIAQLSRAPQRA
jgi:hypothetical protein